MQSLLLGAYRISFILHRKKFDNRILYHYSDISYIKAI
jgi:hypothetical protein